MKTKLWIIIFGLSACFSVVSIADVLDKDVSSLIELIQKGPSFESLCLKFDGLRAGGGKHCKDKLNAALAESVCKFTKVGKANDFTTRPYIDSDCHKAALKVLNKKEPSAVLKEEINSLGKSKTCARIKKFGTPDKTEINKCMGILNNATDK